MKIRVAYPVQLHVISFEQRIREKFTIVDMWADYDKYHYDIELGKVDLEAFKDYVRESVEEGFIEEGSEVILDDILELVKLKKPTIATFRTEFDWDDGRVRRLLWSLGCHQGSWRAEGQYPGKVMFYTIPLTHETVESLRKRMEKLIESEPKFADLHRCYQTLAEGRAPKEPYD